VSGAFIEYTGDFANFDCAAYAAIYCGAKSRGLGAELSPSRFQPRQISQGPIERQGAIAAGGGGYFIFKPFRACSQNSVRPFASSSGRQLFYDSDSAPLLLDTTGSVAQGTIVVSA